MARFVERRVTYGPTGDVEYGCFAFRAKNSDGATANHLQKCNIHSSKIDSGVSIVTLAGVTCT